MLLAILLMAAEPAAATSAPAPTGTPHAVEPVSPAALELSQALNPADRMLALGLKGMELGIEAGLAGPQFTNLEKQHPGLIAATKEALLSVATVRFSNRAPTLQLRYARFYEQRLTPSEMAELLSFFRSPTGRNYLAAGDAIDSVAIAKQTIGDPSTPAKATEIDSTVRSSAKTALEALSAEDQRTLQAFTQRPVWTKLAATDNDMNRLQAQIDSEPDPELDAAMDKALAEVYRRYGLELPAG